MHHGRRRTTTPASSGSIADLLRGDYKRSEYQRVILPLVLLRRLDCVLEPTKRQVLDRLARLTVENVGPILRTTTGTDAYNTSRLISKLKRPEEGGGRLAIVFNGSPGPVERFDQDPTTRLASRDLVS